MMPTARLVLAIVVTAVLASCGGDSSSAPVDPIEITTTAVEAGPPIELDGAIDPSTGAFAAGDWPSACDLVPAATIQSIFPQADDVVLRPTSRQLDILSFVPGVESSDELLTVPEADCVITVGFPQRDLGVDDGNIVLQFNTSVPVAGDPGFVDLNDQSHDSGEPSDVGGGACRHVPESTYSCDLGNVIFRISIDMRRTAQYTGAGSSDYVVDGEEFSFQGSDEAWDAIVHDDVLVPVVEAAVTRLGGTA